MIGSVNDLFWAQNSQWIIFWGGLSFGLGFSAICWLAAQNHQLEAERAGNHRSSEIIWGINAGTWEWDIPSGRMVVNARWAEMFGLVCESPHLIHIDEWRAYIHPEDLPLSLHLIGRCFSKDSPEYSCEMRVRHGSDGWVWVANRGRVVEWYGDTPLRMVGTQSDITKRKLAEFGLRDSEKRFRALFEGSPDPCCLIQATSFTDCNRSALRALGYEQRESLLGHPSGISPDIQSDGGLSSVKMNEMIRISNEQGTHRFEWEFLKSSGELLTAEITLARIDQVDGGTLYCVWRDISERKRVERRDRYHHKVLSMLSEKISIDDLLTSIVLDLEKMRPGTISCVFLFDGTERFTRQVIAPGLVEAVRLELSRVGFSDHEKLRNNSIIFDDFYGRISESAFHFSWAQAIASSEGKMLGALVVFNTTETVLTSVDAEFMADEARLISMVMEKTASQERLQLAASVFTHAREGILIADVQGTIIDVNETFSFITGYSREEAIGKNPRILHSGQQDATFYSGMWSTLLANGHWSGETWNRRKDGDVYAQATTISAVHDSSGRVKNYVALFTDITSIKEHQKQLEHFAHYDALTGLPNRVLLADRLQQAIVRSQRQGTGLAVLYLDLDGFKMVNDTYGHSFGDEVLISIARRMKDALREGDTLSRIGGDEFIAVLTDLASTSAHELILQRLLVEASTPVSVGDIAIQVSTSIGVTLYPNDQGDADQLMRHADQAMYLAKQGGKNQFHTFDVKLDAAVQNQREGLAGIRQALMRNEFILFYQPKINMKTNEMFGVEALIRWNHPELGIIPPNKFLPIIEAHPLAIEVGEWVISCALDQMTRWQAEGIGIVVSVNIGALQLQQPQFPVVLKRLLDAHPDISPECLELEILETSAMEDIVHVSKVMQMCRDIGVRFALDDFGTGYSSLTYLKHLPAEVLKIDQSFIRDMLSDSDDLSIVKSVIGLANAFGRQVIAEGVETQEHGAALLKLGCERAQGYGYARPMPADEIAAWVTSWHKNKIH